MMRLFPSLQLLYHNIGGDGFKFVGPIAHTAIVYFVAKGYTQLISYAFSGYNIFVMHCNLLTKRKHNAT